MNQPANSTNQPATLTAEQVRTVVNRWAAASFFRIANLGNRISIDDVTAHDSFTVRLRTQVEDRSTKRVTVPYGGGYVDDTGRPPDPWTVAVRQPTDFENRAEQVPVPHTEHVETCSSCTGLGIVNCGPCQGWGKVTCPQCQGKGYRERTVTQPAGQPGHGLHQPPGPPHQQGTSQAAPDRGQSISRPPAASAGSSSHANQPPGFSPSPPVPLSQTVREPCHCFGGKVNCTTCQGRGKVSCTGCGGSGRVKAFEQLTVQFRVEDKTELVNHSKVPEHQVKAASGTVLVEEHGPRIETFPPVNADVDAKANGLLRKSHGGDPAATRLLFQRLLVKQVSVHEVAYRFGSGPARRLWIYGDDEQVHAPDAPWAWWKLTFILGGIVVAIAIIVVVVLMMTGALAPN